MIDEKLFMEILNSREDRRYNQMIILNTYKSSLISFTLNTPGIVKDNEMYRKVHKEGMESILKKLIQNNITTIYTEEVNKNTGSEGYIVVDFDPLKLKKILITLEEEHPLGRIFDIDVFDKEHNQISREDLNLGLRKCILCHKDAKVCIRERNHALEDLYFKVESIWKEFSSQ